MDDGVAGVPDPSTNRPNGRQAPPTGSVCIQATSIWPDSEFSAASGTYVNVARPSATGAPHGVPVAASYNWLRTKSALLSTDPSHTSRKRFGPGK